MRTIRYGPRTIDLDLLTYGSESIDTGELYFASSGEAHGTCICADSPGEIKSGNILFGDRKSVRSPVRKGSGEFPVDTAPNRYNVRRSEQAAAMQEEYHEDNANQPASRPNTENGGHSGVGAIAANCPGSHYNNRRRRPSQ